MLYMPSRILLVFIIVTFMYLSQLFNNCLPSSDMDNLFRFLKDKLDNDEHPSRERLQKQNWKFEVKSCPQQQNGYACGTLLYIYYRCFIYNYPFLYQATTFLNIFIFCWICYRHTCLTKHVLIVNESSVG